MKHTQINVQAASFPGYFRWIYITFFFIAFIIYGNSINNEYSLDDEIVINDPLVQKGVKAIPELFTSHYYKDRRSEFGYRPIVKVSYSIEYSVFGSKHHVSHFINIIFYAIASCLLFYMLSLLFNTINILFPFVVTLLFIAHPLHTEVVCSLKNRDVLFSFIGSMCAFIFYLKFAHTKRLHYLLLGMLGLVFAGFSKEDSAVYALIIPFSLFYFKKVSGRELLMVILSIVLLQPAGVLFQNYIVDQGVHHTLLYFENPLFQDTGWWQRMPMGFFPKNT